MRVELVIGGTIKVGGRPVLVADALALLEAIAATGSVVGAAGALNLSYRGVWDRLRAIESDLGQRLVQKSRGHGSVLTSTGAAVRNALALSANGTAAVLAREARALELRLGHAFGTDPRSITVAASHDLLLMEALAEWPEGEITVVGSAEAVHRLTEGLTDVAGFHCGGVGLTAAGSPFTPLSDDASIRLLPLFEREQGFLLAPGNPLRIHGIADIPGSGARYVNRQKGSGTRIWFDRSLAKENIPASSIPGYAMEEFTHQAVAAVIAYGAADVGLGARAAADRFGLDFLSLGWEVYYLAMSAALPTQALDRLVAAVNVRAHRIAGYRLIS